MKKILIALVFCTSLISAASAAPCAILTTNLTRGAESDNVWLLQSFLAAKGYLKASPNGYFGPATLAAVKIYQRSVGLPQTGAVLTLTRAALKREVCFLDGAQAPTETTNQSTSSVVTTFPVSTVSTSTLTVTYMRPTLSSVDRGTFFIGGVTTWNTVIYGTNFSPLSNFVYVRNLMTGKKYTLGTYLSGDGKSITMPTSLTRLTFSCGPGCSEALPAGNYDLTVANQGGESDPVYFSVKAFSISSLSGTLSSPVRQNAVASRLGSVSFSSEVPFYVTNIQANIVTEGLSGNTGVSNLVFKDELTGTAITNFGTEVTASEYQSKIIGIYGSLDSMSSGTLTTSITVTITDYVSKKAATFVAPTFLTSVSGF